MKSHLAATAERAEDAITAGLPRHNHRKLGQVGHDEMERFGVQFDWGIRGGRNPLETIPLQKREYYMTLLGSRSIISDLLFVM